MGLTLESKLIIMKFIDFKDSFQSEEDCKEKFKAYRENVGIVCKNCGGKEHYWLPKKESFQCKNNKCRFRTSLKSGTVMENTKLPYLTWFIAMHLMTSLKNNISALEIQRQIGHKYYEPVFYMLHKLRLVMGKRDAEYNLEGDIELDEGYFSNSHVFEENEFTGEERSVKTRKRLTKENSCIGDALIQNSSIEFEKVKIHNQNNTKVHQNESVGRGNCNRIE
jgi:hypothetical protein